MMAPTPLLILVTGPPCSGKSTLALWLSERFGIPWFGKDMLKESLADSLATSPAISSTALGIASEKLLYRIAIQLLERGTSVILEGTFKDRYAREPLLQLIESVAPAVIQICCSADPSLLGERYLRRNIERHPVHPALDGMNRFEEDMHDGYYDPIEIGGSVLKLDTTISERIEYDPIAMGVERVMNRMISGDGR